MAGLFARIVGFFRPDWGGSIETALVNISLHCYFILSILIFGSFSFSKVGGNVVPFWGVMQGGRN